MSAALPSKALSSQPELLLAGFDAVYPTPEALRERLAAADRPLRIYHGIDPTRPELHLGHTVPLRILKRFQEAGHQAIVVIGDFTATVGDPSGRDAQRSVLSREEVEANALVIKEQLFKVLEPERTELRYNSEWYDDPDRLGSLRKLLEVTHSFTAAQLWERDLFQVRQQKQQPVSLTEFLYPVLQAYDSVALDVDGEVGGSDQLFNMLAGRTLQKQLLQKEKFVISTPLILGTDGRKMSKSYGNTIGVTDLPGDMFGKLMSIADDQILPYMTHLTDRFQSGDERATFERLIHDRPRDAKATLAREIVALYHGTEAATEAERAFDAQFRDHEIPADIPSVRLTHAADVTDLLTQLDATESRSEAVRLIEQGGLTIDGERLTDPRHRVPHQVSQPMIVRIGKRRIVRVTLAQ